LCDHEGNEHVSVSEFITNHLLNCKEKISSPYFQSTGNDLLDTLLCEFVSHTNSYQKRNVHRLYCDKVDVISVDLVMGSSTRSNI
jgi:hypothetical protein